MFHHVLNSREHVKNHVSEDTKGGQPWLRYRLILILVIRCLYLLRGV